MTIDYRWIIAYLAVALGLYLSWMRWRYIESFEEEELTPIPVEAVVAFVALVVSLFWPVIIPIGLIASRKED